MSIRYTNVRGQVPVLSFGDILLADLVNDGGLYVPENLPRFTFEEIAPQAGLPYHELALRVTHPFVTGSIADAGFKKILKETYSVFTRDAVTPLRRLSGNKWVLELLHGPVLAFRDFALQLFGRLFDHVPVGYGERVVIMGAASGNIGPATIEDCRRYDSADTFIIHPHNRASGMQRRQMTTTLGGNIHNITVEDNFDDCQEMVKTNLAGQGSPKGTCLIAVNSTNWAWIMTQIVYYFHAALQLGAPHRSMAFSVPTSNFGDIFAGYLARNMGLPASQLIIATNRNDILHHFMNGNRYDRDTLHPSLSPSMDIMVPSNFEHLLLDLCDRNDKAVAEPLGAFKASDKLSVGDQRWTKARKLFGSPAVSDEQTCETIAEVYRSCSKLLDPHTAIGVRAACKCRCGLGVPMVTLGAAYPVKFPEAVEKANIGQVSTLPAYFVNLFEHEERCTVLPNELAKVQTFASQYGNRGKSF